MSSAASLRVACQTVSKIGGKKQFHNLLQQRAVFQYHLNLVVDKAATFSWQSVSHQLQLHINYNNYINYNEISIIADEFRVMIMSFTILSSLNLN